MNFNLTIKFNLKIDGLELNKVYTKDYNYNNILEDNAY